MMRFIDEDHKRNYQKYMAMCRYDDCWHRALFYTLTLNKELVAHINQIYDFEKGLVKPECIHEPWQTGESKRLTRLAFQLYTDKAPTAYSYDEQGHAKEDVSELKRYLISEMLCYLSYEWEYVLEAIKIRLGVA